MSRIFRFLAIILCWGVALSARGQALRLEFRPAVLAGGADSLVNQIDAAGLLKAGQEDGAVMFCSIVSPNGEPVASWTYRSTAGTEALTKEVEKRLATVKFTPPIYEHQKVSVLLNATVFFSAEGKPHVHIFLNQDSKELKAKTDYIAPQPVIGADSGFTGLHRPDSQTSVLVTGIVDLGLKVSDKGKLEELTVLTEDPPLLGFAAAAAKDFRDAKFIPAYRSGAIEADENSVPGLLLDESHYA